MRVSWAEMLQIFHYVNGDSEKISQITNVTDIESLRDLIQDSPSLYQLADDVEMGDTSKQIRFELNDCRVIRTYEGDDKIYTPSKSNWDYFINDREYHGQEDRVNASWFNWSPYLDNTSSLGSMIIKSLNIYNEYDRIAIAFGQVGEGIDLNYSTHNGEDVLQFGYSSNRNIRFWGYKDGNITELYPTFELFDLNTEELKPYYYNSYGVMTAYGNFDISFESDRDGFRSIFELLQSTNSYILNMKGVLSSNMWVFASDLDAQEYLRTGDTSKSINKKGQKKSTDDKLYYYTYKESTVNETTGSLSNETLYNASFKLVNEGDKVRFVKLDNDTCELKFNCEHVNLFVNGSYVLTRVSDLDLYNHSPYIVMNTTVKTLHGDLKTNIPIVNDFSDDESDNFTTPTKDNFTGEKGLMSNANLTGTGVTNIGCYHITGAILNNILSYLFTTDEDAYTTFKEKIWQYNENPSECIIDINYIPFNINNYVTKGLKTLQFGSLKFDGTHSYFPTTILDNIVLSSKPVTNVNITIQPTYGDFRDYNALSYNLYLPYYGIIQLDRTCVGQNLKVVSYFDAFTGSLKYYVYIGSALVGSYNCNVGKHIAFMGSDWLNKSRENMQSAIGTIASSGISAVRGLSALGSGNVLGVASAVSDMEQALISNNIQEGLTPNTMTQGVTSDGVNIYDDMNFYLIIEEYETIKPTNLYSEYGIPCYIIGTLATCKGYCEVATIKLNTSATEEEQKEIIELLKGGIIV